MNVDISIYTFRYCEVPLHLVVVDNHIHYVLGVENNIAVKFDGIVEDKLLIGKLFSEFKEEYEQMITELELAGNSKVVMTQDGKALIDGL